MVVPTILFSTAAQNADPSHHRYLDRCTHYTPATRRPSQSSHGGAPRESAGAEHQLSQLPQQTGQHLCYARKTVATLIDDEGLSARIGADHLGHAKVSMTQNVYMTRGRVHLQVAELLDRTVAASEASRKR
jgi:integrase